MGSVKCSDKNIGPTIVEKGKLTQKLPRLGASLYLAKPRFRGGPSNSAPHVPHEQACMRMRQMRAVCQKTKSQKSHVSQ